MTPPSMGCVPPCVPETSGPGPFLRFDRFLPLRQLPRSATIPAAAGVAKLVDAPDSKSGTREGVSVRARPPVPRNH